MSVATATLARPRPALAWRWVHVGVAAAAMVATLPGRTHGLGLITEPLLDDLRPDRVDYAAINLWATLLGAAFCLPCGWLLDRLGARTVLTAVLLSLGLVVVAMSRLDSDSGLSLLFGLILLTRGLGQSALSVVSLALVGKSSGRRSGLVIGVYSFLTALGFMGAFGAVKFALETWHIDWRTLWESIGLVLIALAPVSWLLARPVNTEPEIAHPLSLNGPSPSSRSFTLRQALLTTAFWVFALAVSLYGLIAAGVSLFNQAILEERHFKRDVYLTITTIGPLVGLAGNLATGWLATRWPMNRLLAVAMLLLTGALLAFPFVTTLTEVYAYAVVMGLAGGMVTMLFFGIWPAFGPLHLGKIQGAAQMLTVFASAGGPLLLALCQRVTQSYLPFFQSFAAASLLLGLLAWLVPMPKRDVP